MFAMLRLLIGQPSLTGKLATYAKAFGMVEVRPVDTPLPGAKTLRKWREQVPPAFAFSVVLPRCVARLDDDEGVDDALARSLAAARSLEASCLLLATPASVRPTKRNRQRIAALAERLPRDGQLLAWHAAGIWNDEEIMQTAADSGLLPVFDAAQQPLPPGPVVYTRIQALGNAARLGSERIERIADQLANRREAFVVVDRGIAKSLRRRLVEAVEQRRATAGASVPLIFLPSGAPGSVLEADDEEQ